MTNLYDQAQRTMNGVTSEGGREEEEKKKKKKEEKRERERLK